MDSLIQRILSSCLISLSLTSLYGQVQFKESHSIRQDMLLARTLSEVQELRRELREIKKIVAPSTKKKVKTWRKTFWHVSYGVLLVSVPVSVGYLLYKVYSGDIADVIVDQSYDNIDKKVDAHIDKFAQKNPRLHSLGSYAKSLYKRAIQVFGYEENQVGSVESSESQEV